MNDQTRQEITRLLLEQVVIDDANAQMCVLSGSSETIHKLLSAVIKSDYGRIHPAWAIPLYLSRN